MNSIITIETGLMCKPPRLHGKALCVALLAGCLGYGGLTGSVVGQQTDIGFGGVGLTDRVFESGDGLRLRFDDGFAMWRVSGTEPVLRIYAEAAGLEALARRLASARRALRRVAPR